MLFMMAVKLSNEKKKKKNCIISTGTSASKEGYTQRMGAQTFLLL